MTSIEAARGSKWRGSAKTGVFRSLALCAAALLSATACRPVPGTVAEQELPSTPPPVLSAPATPVENPATPSPARKRVEPAKSLATLTDAGLIESLDEYRNPEGDRKGAIYRIAESVHLGATRTETVAALREAFALEAPPDLKREILGRLAGLPDPDSVAAIAEGLAPEQPSAVRLSAIFNLQFLGDRRALPILRALVADPDTTVREAAAQAVKSIREDHPVADPQTDETR